MLTNPPAGAIACVSKSPGIASRRRARCDRCGRARMARRVAAAYRAAFQQAGRVHDLALDPGTIGFVRDRFDHEAEQAIAEVGIFEFRVGLDHRRDLQILLQFAQGEERPPVIELAGVVAIADQARAVRHELRNGGARDLGMEVGNEAAHRIV